MDEWYDVTDESERKQARRAYEEAQRYIPEEGLPDEFGEVEAAITIGIDADDNFHIVANAPEEKQIMVSNAVDVVQDVLANYSEYREEVDQNSGDYDG